MKRLWRKRNRPWLLGLGAWLAAGTVWGLLAVVGLLSPPGHAQQPALVLVQPSDPAQPGAAAQHPRTAEEPLLPPARPQAVPPRSYPDESHRGSDPLPDATRPKLAVVIDDIGHNLQAPRAFLRTGLPLTYSVLPGLPYSREAARLIEQAGRPYLIHLPMEPLDYPHTSPGPRPLLLQLDAERTRARLDAYLAELPHAVGANNHMGSAYTQDAEHMGWVQAELAARGLPFLHSRTIATDIPAQVARAQSHGVLERDVFLDHDLSEAAVEQAWRQALQVARRRGQAVAIGHPHQGTLRVLRRMMAEGPGDVDLVPLTRLRWH